MKPIYKITSLLPCLAFGLASAAHAQLFSGYGSGSASVTPGTPSSASFSSSFPQAPLDGSQPGNTSGSTTFTATGVTAVGSATSSYSTSAGWSGLSTSANASHTYPTTAPNSSFGDFLGFGAQSSAYSVATLTVNDLVFSGPSSAIPVSLNLLFSGTQTGSDSRLSYFSLTMDGAAAISGSERFYGQYGIYAGGVDSLLTDYAGGSTTLQSGIWAAPTGVPLTLTVQLYVQVQSVGGYDTSGSTDASATLSLPTSGPVFNLPAGFSADSASLQLSGNVYAPVPEPEHYAALAGLGLLGFALWRRRMLTA